RTSCWRHCCRGSGLRSMPLARCCRSRELRQRHPTSLPSGWSAFEDKARSIAIGRARRKQRAIGPRLIDRARERGPRQQALAVSLELAAVLADRMHPVGIEQRWPRRTISKAKVAAGPALILERLIKPRIRAVEQLVCLGDTKRVARVRR